MTDYSKLAAQLPDEQPTPAAPVYLATDTDPEAEAGLRKLSKVTGMPVEALRLKPVEQEARRAEAVGKYDALLQEAPKTAAFLGSVDNAAIAHDDTENMGLMERTLRGLSGGFQEGVGMAASGTGILADIAQRRFVGTFSSLFLPKAKQGQGMPTTESLAGPLIGEGWRQTGGITKDFARQQTMVPSSQQTFYDKVLGGVGQVGAQVAMAPFTRGAGLYAQGADAMDEKLKGDKVTAGQYDAAVLAGAAVTGITEKWALDKLLGPLDTKIKSAVLATLARIGIASAAEGVQEFSENAIHDIIREVVVNDALNKPVAYLGESINLGQSVEEGEIGAAVGGIIRSMVEAGLHIKARGKGAQSAEATAQFIEQLNQGAAASKVLARDPETFQAFIKSAAEDGPVTDIYIDADVLNQSGVAEQVLAASPAAAEQYQEALATGGQVRIPIDEYTARIAPQEYAQQLLDDLRIRPEDMTRREAKAFAESGGMAELEATMSRIIGDKAQDDTFAASRERVKQAVLDNLNALGRFTPQKNELDATLIAARSATRAAQLGITPEQFFDQYVLKVVAQGESGQVLNQFAGQSALTADTGALKSAQDRVKAGEDAETVRKETGWHTGTDGKWRFEISDADAKLTTAINSLDRGGNAAADIESVTYRKNDDGTYSVSMKHDGAKSTSDFAELNSVPEEVVRAILPDDVFAAVQRGDGEAGFIGANLDDAKTIKTPFRFEGMNALPLDMVIDHPALFAAYPALRQVMVKVDPKAGIGGSLAEMGDGTFVITVGQGQKQSTMLHEIQHAIQSYEGFASGGSIRDMGRRVVEARGEVDALSQRMQRIENEAGAEADLWVAKYPDRVNDALDYLRKQGMFDEGDNVRDSVRYAIHDRDPSYQSLTKQWRQAKEAAQQSPTESYRRLAGEVEARNTQARANMTAPERQAASPQATADVAERDQIVTFAQGLAEMVSDQPTEAELSEAKRQLDEQLAIADRMIAERGGLFAPNGEASKLSREQWAMVRTANFKNWFGEWENGNADAGRRSGDEANRGSKDPRGISGSSEVMQETNPGTVGSTGREWRLDSATGEPRVFYHGTSDEITAFDLNHGNRLDHGWLGTGVYVTSDNALAGSYSRIKPGSGDPRIMDLFANVRNPYVATLDEKQIGRFKNREWADRLAKTAKELGYDGVAIELSRGTIELVAFDPNQIKSATGNAGTFSAATDSILYQPDGGPGPVTRGWFNPATNTIALLKNADLSTFLHESGHYFFETDIAIAGQILRENGAFGIDTMTQGQQQILRDVSALLKWHGIEGDISGQLAQWEQMGFEERRGYHEKTAESFERYLLEGKAPSIELLSAFQHFRQWMLSVYKSLKAFLAKNPDAGELSDEVRSVFDRMLATDEEIRLAQQARSMIPLFADAVNAGMTPSEFAEYQKLGDEATRAAIDEMQVKVLQDMKWLKSAIKKLKKEARVRRAEVRSDVRAEVLREPVYQAWDVLTKATDADGLADKKPKRSESVDAATDNLFTAIAKMGGLNRDTLVAQWGIDPKDKPDAGLFGKPVWRAKDGGASLDAMVEALTQEGYLTPDENGKGDVAELEEKFKEELRGNTQYSRIKDYEPDALAGQGEELGGVTAARIDRASLDDMEGLEPEVISKLESLGMTAKTGGIHPDVLSEVLPGWTSGDELVRAIVAARPLKDEIEARTDQRMIEQYSDLATPEAIEQAADMAIHNDARERFLATEYNALAKAAGERKLLLAAAREFARNLIGRQRIRDIRPSQYTAAATRAAKAAMTAKDVAQKAAEKRNQILSAISAREAYRAKEDTEKGLRYLKKFNGATIRKRISSDYVDQIEKLLEFVDLRKQSLKDIDRRKSFGAFVRAQIDKGIVPAMSDNLLPPNLRAQYVAKVMERNEDGELIIKDDVEQAKVLADFLDMADARSYKDMTVDEFRGLIETIRQIEHLGRKKKSLLTARDGKTYEQKRDELVASVVANSEQLPSRLNRTIPDKNQERLSSIRDFRMSLRKIGMIMRLLDGNKDGGPMWDFFVRSANERGDWETEMIAQSSEALTKALRPVFKLKAGMRGKGVFFESIGRSLNREQRIGLALNVGNEGNLQRLLDGEGWTYADIKPVLESLTAAEWQAVQEVWDHMDSYRPMIAAIEKRTVGAEPEWVQPMQFMVKTADGQELTLKGGYYPVKYDTEASRRSQQLEDATDAKAAMDGAYSSSTTHRSFVKKRSEAVIGRPLLLSMNGVYSGVQDVIHDLAWREWLIDASKMMNSTTLDAAIRDKHGADTVRAIDTWIKDIAAGTRKPSGAGDRAAAFLRRNVAAAGLALNFMNAVQNVTGLQNSVERIGAKWMAQGQKEYLSGPIEAAAWVREKSSLMRNRARTQFRDLNELRNIVENGDGIGTKARANQFILMSTTQKIVDTPTWIGAYRSAEADGAVIQYEDGTIDDSKAIAMADQAVIDAQGSGMTKDLSAIERGGEIAKLFTVYYSYMNTTYNLAANRISGARGGDAKQRGSAAFHILSLMSVPIIAMDILRSALTPGDDDDWDDPEKLAKKLGNEQMSYLFGMVPFLREFYPAVQPLITDKAYGYQGPSGMRMAGDAVKFTQQAGQGEFDDGFRKAAVGLSGSLFGLPAAQINRTWTGVEAIADDKTVNPAALLFGYQEPR